MTQATGARGGVAVEHRGNPDDLAGVDQRGARGPPLGPMTERRVRLTPLVKPALSGTRQLLIGGAGVARGHPSGQGVEAYLTGRPGCQWLALGDDASAAAGVRAEDVVGEHIDPTLIEGEEGFHGDCDCTSDVASSTTRKIGLMFSAAITSGGNSDHLPTPYFLCNALRRRPSA